MPSLGSQDHVDDAIDSLSSGQFQYLLLTGTHTDYTRLDSALDKQARDMLLEWVRSGDFEKMLLNHYERNPITDA